MNNGRVDSIDLKVETHPLEYGFDADGRRIPTGAGASLLIAVNGEDLLTLVAAAERAWATADRQPDLAGSYHYLHSYEFPSGLLYGDISDRDLSYGDREKQEP
jgi:hypothetical protein